jgi:hypothetical protein
MSIDSTSKHIPVLRSAAAIDGGSGGLIGGPLAWADAAEYGGGGKSIDIVDESSVLLCGGDSSWMNRSR